MKILRIQQGYNAHKPCDRRFIAATRCFRRKRSFHVAWHEQCTVSGQNETNGGFPCPTGTSEFDSSINYLDTMVREVGAVVSSGTSVDQTVSTVTMTPFQGYKRWDWIHKIVNVPTTYSELKK